MPRLFSNYSPRFGFIGWVLAILDCNDSKLGYIVLKQSFRKTFNSFITEPLLRGTQIKLETIQSKSLSPITVICFCIPILRKLFKNISSKQGPFVLTSL